MIDVFNSPACLKCIEVHGGCCSISARVPLLIEDMDAIKSKGFELKDYAFAQEYDKEDLKGYPSWVHEGLIQVDGKLFKVNTRENKGKCVFLEEGRGCVLADKRPFACRIFPFFVNEEGEVIYKTGGIDCRIEKLGLPVAEGIKLIQETEESVRLYFSKIKKDCIENKEKQKEIILKLRGQL